MNLMILSPGIFPCITGGMEIFNYYFCKELSKQNYIYLFSSCNSINIENIRIIKYFPRLLLIKRFGISKINIILQETIRILILRKKIDLIIVPFTSISGYRGYYLPFLKRVIRIPYIIINHGGGLKKWSNYFIYKNLFENADCLIAVSKPIKEEYEKRTCRNNIYIPPLLPFSVSNKSKNRIKKHYGINEDEMVLFFAGSMKNIKSPDTLLIAYKMLGKEFIRNYKCRLIFAGDGELLANMKESVIKLSISKSIIFLGNVNYDEMKDLYSIANIFIITSVYEGTPLSLLEAMYNKKLILASNVKGINNIIYNEKNGLLFDYNNNNQLYELLKYSIINFKYLSYLSENAFKSYCENYSYSDMINDYNRIFNQIVKTSSKE